MKLDRGVALLLKKALVGFALMFFAALLQTSFLGIIQPFGAIPDLSLIASIGVGCFCGPVAGSIYGVAAGAVSYALGDVGLAFLPLVYGAAGFLSGLLVEKFFKGGFAVWCIYVFGGGLMKAAYSLICCLLFSEELQLWAVLGKTVLPELAGTFILGIALYVPLKKICKYL